MNERLADSTQGSGGGRDCAHDVGRAKGSRRRVGRAAVQRRTSRATRDHALATSGVLDLDVFGATPTPPWASASAPSTTPPVFKCPAKRLNSSVCRAVARRRRRRHDGQRRVDDHGRCTTHPRPCILVRPSWRVRSTGAAGVVARLEPLASTCAPVGPRASTADRVDVVGEGSAPAASRPSSTRGAPSHGRGTKRAASSSPSSAPRRTRSAPAARVRRLRVAGDDAPETAEPSEMYLVSSRTPTFLDEPASNSPSRVFPTSTCTCSSIASCRATPSRWTRAGTTPSLPNRAGRRPPASAMRANAHVAGARGAGFPVPLLGKRDLEPGEVDQATVRFVRVGEVGIASGGAPPGAG